MGFGKLCVGEKGRSEVGLCCWSDGQPLTGLLGAITPGLLGTRGGGGMHPDTDMAFGWTRVVTEVAPGMPTM